MQTAQTVSLDVSELNTLYMAIADAEANAYDGVMIPMREMFDRGSAAKAPGDVPELSAAVAWKLHEFADMLKRHGQTMIENAQELDERVHVVYGWSETERD